MMFNSINNDINNYNSIPSYKRQYMKQPFNNINLINRQSLSSKEKLKINNPSIFSPHRQSSSSKIRQSMPINERNFYKQNYEVNSPFEENLRHSDVRSYNSEQFYPGLESSDKLSENSNKWSRNTASYFPTSQLLNQQQYIPSQYPSSNQNFTESNAFKKHTEQKNVYNFDSFSSKSKSRIKEMNEKIDQTTKSILKNGLLHQREVFTASSALRSSSKQQPQRSKEKRGFESPRIIEQNQYRILEDTKNHGSIERKKQYPVNNYKNMSDFQREVYAQSKMNTVPDDFPFEKHMLSENNNYERMIPDRMPPYIQSESPMKMINSPLESNKRFDQHEQNQGMNNHQDDMIDFLDFEHKDIYQQSEEILYRLPSTHRKDITFNVMNKDHHMLSRESNERNEFSLMKSSKFTLDKPILYTSESQQTFNKEKNHHQINKNALPQFELKPYPKSNMQLSKSKVENKTEFQPTDLIVLNKNSSNSKIYEKMPSKTHLNFNNENRINENNNFNSRRNEEKHVSNPHEVKNTYQSFQPSRFENNHTKIDSEEPFKRTSSFERDIDFFEFEYKNDKEGNAFTYMEHKENPDNFRFEEFEDENDEYKNFEMEEENVMAKRMTENKNLREIEDNRNYTHSSAERTEKKNEEEFPTGRSISSPKVSILQTYMSRIKDKESQVIAISLILLAVVILIIQLAS